MTTTVMSMPWNESFRIHFYEAEPDGRVAIPAICRFLEDTADRHCISFGMAPAQLQTEGRMWVLVRLALRMRTLPRLGREVTVETWSSHRTGGYRAYRDFRILDAAGQVLGEASSLWLLLDASTRRPLRLPELDGMHSSATIQMKLVDTTPLKTPDRVDLEESHRVRWRELDSNGHANNVWYIEWLLETVPVAVRREWSMTALDIHFQAEALLDEEVVSSAAREDAPAVIHFRHSVRTRGGKILATAHTTWEAVP